MSVSKIKRSWWVDFRFRGARYRQRSPLNTKAGAKDYEITLRGRLARGEPTKCSEIARDQSFAQFTEYWFEVYVPTNKRSEQCAKERILRRHLVPWFGAKPLTAIRSEDIAGYKRAKLAVGIARKTVNNHLAVLGKVLSSAMEWELIRTRPYFKLLDRAKTSRKDFLSPLESAAVLRDYAEPMWNTMVRMALRTGMRPNELTALKWEDVDLKQDTVTVRASFWNGHLETPKDDEERELPITMDLHRALSELPRRGEFVFCQDSGEPLTDSMRRWPLRRLCQRVGIRSIIWYTFRHTFASRLLNEGAPLLVVKELMGHASITTTMLYVHPSSETHRDAVEMLKHAEEREVSKNFGQPVPNLDPKSVRESLEAMAA